MLSHPVSRAFSEAFKDLAALVWPVACVGCGAADRELCRHCRSGLRNASPLTVETELTEVATYARGSYTGVLREVVIAYKHGGRAGFARLLGEQLSHPLSRALAQASEMPLVVAAPSRAGSVRKRGFRHVEAVVKAALVLLPDPAQPVRVLRSTRGRQGQVGLDAETRTHNAAHVAVRSHWRARLRGRDVVVVDDILTTGATVRAVCDVLTAAGARVVAVAVLAVVAHDATLGANRGGTGVASWSSIRERRNGALERPTRLSHLGGHHGREHPRQERWHH